MNKTKAELILGWWQDENYWLDWEDERVIWHEVEDNQIVSYTMAELKSYIDVAPI